jgi:hypothetical protein
MVAAGMLLGWAAYGLGLFGWTMFRDYNVTLGQLLSPVHPYGSGGETWPPAPMPDTQIWPGTPQASAASGSPSSGSSSSSNSGSGGSTLPGGPGSSGGCPPGQYLIGGKCVQGAAN